MKPRIFTITTLALVLFIAADFFYSMWLGWGPADVIRVPLFLEVMHMGFMDPMFSLKVTGLLVLLFAGVAYEDCRNY